ncbi:MAG: 30S ribosomal protein S6 [Oscillospiraceae bacterium]|jgi:small subunit ribosomal protein S6|nr:30S ribosomal protein S6 [Oscillospiraceae bacterium]
MAKVSGKYELLYILDTDLGEENIAAAVEKFKKLIEENGTIAETDEWGRRRLAYRINDKADGHYVIVRFESKPEFPQELTRVLGITDGVLRYLITDIA